MSQPTSYHAWMQVLADAHAALLGRDVGDDPLRLLRRAETVLSRRSDLLLVLEHCHSTRDRKVLRSQLSCAWMVPTDDRDTQLGTLYWCLTWGNDHEHLTNLAVSLSEACAA